jgi:ketosteroid isomerase-like protein
MGLAYHSAAWPDAPNSEQLNGCNKLKIQEILAGYRMPNFREIALNVTIVGTVAAGLITLSHGSIKVPAVPACIEQEKARGVDEDLRKLLTAQAADWNRGDIDAFMQGYWKSEETTFAGTSGISRGWQTVLDHYHKNYPDRATMGHLEFSEIEITPLGNDAALILGRWHLNRDAGPVGGIFTLVARRFPEGWRIIHDHTSTDAEKSGSSK